MESDTEAARKMQAAKRALFDAPMKKGRIA
jgi:hypothetical protein